MKYLLFITSVFFFSCTYSVQNIDNEVNTIYFGGNYHNLKFFDCLDCDEKSYVKFKKTGAFQGYEDYYHLFPSILKADAKVKNGHINIISVKNIVSSY